jgi:hypothetical protein
LRDIRRGDVGNDGVDFDFGVDLPQSPGRGNGLRQLFGNVALVE